MDINNCTALIIDTHDAMDNYNSIMEVINWIIAIQLW